MKTQWAQTTPKDRSKTLKRVNYFLQTKFLRLWWRFANFVKRLLTHYLIFVMAMHSLLVPQLSWDKRGVVNYCLRDFDLFDFCHFWRQVLPNFGNYLTPYAKKIYEFFVLIIRTYWLDDMNWSESGRATKRACSFILNANIVLSYSQTWSA